MEVTIKTTVSNRFLMKMLARMIDSRLDDLPTKQEFIIYTKRMIQFFGIDSDSQFGERDFMYSDNYEIASKLFTEWKLDKRVRL